MKACAHPRQAERLATLRSYDVLDTPRESDFDDIVLLASRICQTPIAVVNLIDEERQWFKAEVGLGTRETPLETSICSHVILEQDFTMIEDTQADVRTADNELCTPVDGLRFYAGALLKAENGLPIGTLCVLDNKPNSLDDEQKHALSVLARRVMKELDLRRALRTQDLLKKEIDHRVKNSLAAISGFVRLYKAEAERNGDVSAAFDAVQRQLDAVAAVHRAIYLAGEIEMLDLGEYLAALSGLLEESLPPNMSVRADAPELLAVPKLASALGLVANEFAANTVRHVRQEELEVKIEYRLTARTDEIVFSCSSNVPEGCETSDPASTGIGRHLMEAAISQFGGKLEHKGDADGFELTARLPASAAE